MRHISLITNTMHERVNMRLCGLLWNLKAFNIINLIVFVWVLFVFVVYNYSVK